MSEAEPAFSQGRDGSYAYYTTTKFTYILPGFRGVVDWSLQPRGRGVRPFTRPLRGAKITGFTRLKDGGCRLSYQYRGETSLISWRSTGRAMSAGRIGAGVREAATGGS